MSQQQSSVIEGGTERSLPAHRPQAQSTCMYRQKLTAFTDNADMSQIR